MITARDIQEDESLFTFKDSSKELKTYRIAPNFLLLRKCTKPLSSILVGEATQESRIADAMLEKITANPSFENADGWCEVVAVGKKREYTEEEQDRFDIPKGYHCPAKRGDFVVIPECSDRGRLWRYAITGLSCDIEVADFIPFLWVEVEG